MNARLSWWWAAILFLFVAMIIWQWRTNTGLRQQKSLLEQRVATLELLSHAHAALQNDRDELIRLRDSQEEQLLQLRAEMARGSLLTNDLRAAKTEHARALARSIALEDEVNQLKIHRAEKPPVPRIGAWIGAGISDVKGVASGGVALSVIFEGGPAQRANLETGDIILGIDGQPVISAEEFKMHMAQKVGGRAVLFDVVRKDSALKVQVTPSDWPQ